MTIRETKLVNAFETTLDGAVASGDNTGISLADDPGVTSDVFLVVDPDNDSQREVVLWTSGAYGAMAWTRDVDAKHGTDPAHADGTTVRLAVVKQHIEDLHDRVDAVALTGDVTGSLVAGTSAIATTAVKASGGDFTIYEDANNADVSLKLGTSATEALSIEVLNGGSNKTAEEVKIKTSTASGTANHGKISIYIDDTEIMDIDDGGIDMASGKTVAINGTDLATTAAGLVYITGATVSDDTGIDVDSCFTSTYRNYRLIFDGQGEDSGAEQLWLQLNASSAHDTTANSDIAGTISYISSGVAHGGQASVDVAHFEVIGNWIKDAAFSCVIDFIAPQATDQTQIFSKVTSHYTDTEQGTQYAGGIKDETTAYDGFYLFCDDTQTLSGTYKLYGWANS